MVKQNESVQFAIDTAPSLGSNARATLQTLKMLLLVLAVVIQHRTARRCSRPALS